MFAVREQKFTIFKPLGEYKFGRSQITDCFSNVAQKSSRAPKAQLFWKYGYIDHRMQCRNISCIPIFTHQSSHFFMRPHHQTYRVHFPRVCAMLGFSRVGIPLTRNKTLTFGLAVDYICWLITGQCFHSNYDQGVPRTLLQCRITKGGSTDPTKIYKTNTRRNYRVVWILPQCL